MQKTVRGLMLSMIALFALGAVGADLLAPQKLAEGVYVLPGESGNPSALNEGRVGNIGFVIGATGITVINTGSSLRRAHEFTNAIRRISDKPIVAVIITHPAQEFLFGNSWFSAEGIPIWSSQRTPKLMAERCSHCLETLEHTVGAERMYGTQLVLPAGRSFTGERLSLGGRWLRISEGPPGTVPGNLLVLDEATGVVFVGALLSVHRVPGVQDTTPQKWIDALAVLDKPRYRQVVPAFGPVQRSRQDILHARQALTDYLRALDEQARSLYRQQTKLADVEALSELPAFKDWDNYADNHPRNLFYRFLQLESEELQSP